MDGLSRSLPRRPNLRAHPGAHRGQRPQQRRKSPAQSTANGLDAEWEASRLTASAASSPGRDAAHLATNRAASTRPLDAACCRPTAARAAHQPFCEAGRAALRARGAGGARTWRRAAALLDRALQREQRAGGRVRALRLRARLAHRAARARARAHLREPAAGRALRARAPPAIYLDRGCLPWSLLGAGHCAAVCCSAGQDRELRASCTRASSLTTGGWGGEQGVLTPALCKRSRTRSYAGLWWGGRGGRAVWQAGPMGSLR